METQAGQVRAGEELDLERLNPWLLDRISGLSGLPEVTQYSGGASNWTYCLSYAERDVILRRAPAGTKAKGAHDMGREHRLQAALKPHYDYVPAMLAHSNDESLVGAEFYVMEKLDGVVPRQNFPRGFDVSRQHAKQLCFNAVDSLVELHNVDYRAAGLSELAKGTGYINRQVEGWIKRYENVVTWHVPSAKGVAQWLRENQPKQELLCLTHNDFRLDNMVLNAQNPAQVEGILDWELATIGDPWLDLATMLVYWIQADDDFIARGTRRQPTHVPGMLSRDEVREYYLSKTQWPEQDFRFYEVLSSYRLAGIAQQIYYRYHKKQTRNPQFKNIWVLVNYLQRRCRKLIKQGG